MITLDILADLEFFKTEDKGRKGPTPPKFFSCVITINENNYDARLLLEEIGSIAPGENKKKVPIKFLSSETALEKVNKGTEFSIRDGQVIGKGTVVRIFESEYIDHKAH